MQIIAESERLYLRLFLLSDAIHFYNMNLDKDVIKFTGDIPFKSETEAAQFLSKYDQYKRYKMGRWAVCLKKNNEFIGWCGLKYHPKESFVEIGYRFYKKYWNNGYATESSKAAINYGFNTLKLNTIYAHAHVNNMASHNVLDKCNFKFIGEKNYGGMPIKRYKIENSVIKIITAQETYIVRQPILRADRSIEDCKFEGDNLETTLHLGLFLNKTLVGVASFLNNNSQYFKDFSQFQLRGMAILIEHQKKGFGNLLLKEGELLLSNKKATRIWFNARETATLFYKKNGYSIVGKPFDIPYIGTHFVMTKKIN